MDETNGSEVKYETVPLEAVRYDAASGLVPVVVQGADDGRVLMVAYANREALKRTLDTGDAWFWSRSRQDYWRKGATSGNVQKIVDVRLDCDGDTVLYLVSAAGPACHTGEVSCFYRRMVRKVMNRTETRVQAGSGTSPDVVSVATEGSTDSPAMSVGSVGNNGSPVNGDASVLQHLWDVISARWDERPQGSYTTYLFTQGIDKVAKKVGEEGVEVALAAKNAMTSDTGKAELASESADLLYHLLALWKTAGVTPAQVYEVLKERER